MLWLDHKTIAAVIETELSILYLNTYEREQMPISLKPLCVLITQAGLINYPNGAKCLK